MAWEVYDPRTIRTIMLSRGLTAGDVAKRTRGKVGRTTVRNLILGERETAQEKTLAAVAKALYVSVDKLRGEE